MSSLRGAATGAVVLLALSMATGCASTKVTGSETALEPGTKLARPQHIIVYDFAATADGIPRDSAIADQVVEPETPPTEKELEVGRKLGEEVAKRLVSEIEDMGLPAVRGADMRSAAADGDLVIRGYFLSVDEGSTVKRLAIGFGAGGADLKTFVEGYVMTDRGLHRLGSRTIDAGGAGKGPGMVVPIAVTIATANPIGLVVGGAVKAAGELSGHSTIEGSGKRTAGEIAKELKPKFQEQGWIE